MTEHDIRLECVRLTQPRDLGNPDITKWLERAKLIEDYVKGDGYAQAPSESPRRQSRKTGQAEVTTAPAQQ